MFSIFMGNVFQNYEQRFSKQRATNFTSLPFLFHYAASGLQLLNVLFAVLLIAGGGDQLVALAVDVDDLDSWIILE